MDDKTSEPAVLARGLRKSFTIRGARIEAVRGLDLTVHPGDIFGLLGPNGAGKTTVLRMLTTLLAIDAGHALVAGIDVLQAPALVRGRIGVVGQLGGADLAATGRENLLLQARLYGLSGADARRRADALAEQLALAEFLDRPTRTYSGGQRRRLEVALGIVHRPPILFLDEPTTGLDPQNRANLWQVIRRLRDEGTTVVLVTHYLEEAEALADRVAIVDDGTVVVEGTPRDLKRTVAADAIVIRPRDALPGALDALRDRLAAEPFVRGAAVDGGTLHLRVSNGAAALPLISEWLRVEGIALAGLSMREVSLDDVFLTQTGRSLRDAGAAAPEAVVA